MAVQCGKLCFHWASVTVIGNYCVIGSVVYVEGILMIMKRSNVEICDFINDLFLSGITFCNNKMVF